jgi:hypothetical protein
MATADQILTNKQQDKPESKSRIEGVRDWVRENHERQPSLGAELSAMAREAVKDVRGAIYESYFGAPERMGEAGTPLNPTSQIVTAEMGNFHGYEQMLAEYGARGSVYGRDQEKGMER